MASNPKKQITVKSKTGTEIKHTFDEEEAAAFAKHITSLVQNDADCKSILPVTSKNLFEAVSKGVLFWYYILNELTVFFSGI